MNSDILPQGPQETIVNGTINRPVLIVYAETNLVISNLVYEFQATPAHANAVAGFTLPAGRYLCYVKSCTITGTATIVYKY